MIFSFMFQRQLVCIFVLLVFFIPDYALAGAVSSRMAPIEQHSVSAKSFLRKMELLPVEMREEIMSKPWKLSSLAALPVEMRPLLSCVRHIVVDDIRSFRSLFNALQKLKTIDLTPLNWQWKRKRSLTLISKMLEKITERQAERPFTILGLNELFIASILRTQYNVAVVLFSNPRLRAMLNPGVNDNYAIRSASINGRDDLVKLLLADGRADPTVDNNYAIRYTSEFGLIDVLKLLLTDGRANPAAQSNFAIRHASANGFVDVVKLLLEDGRADPAANDNDPICYASENGHAEVVKLLLADRRADPTAANNFAIISASENGHADVVKLLLEDGRANPAAKNNAAIFLASYHNHYEVFQLLKADHRVDPTMRSICAIL